MISLHDLSDYCRKHQPEGATVFCKEMYWGTMTVIGFKYNHKGRDVISYAAFDSKSTDSPSKIFRQALKAYRYWKEKP